MAHMKVNVNPSQRAWLPPSMAAKYLSVHIATLRRWADQGDIPHMVTPGGHRRFALSDLETFAAEHKVYTHALSAPETWAARAMSHAREDMPSQASAHWLAVLNDDARERHRQVGRKLMALTLQYISADDGAHLLDEARMVGREYGEVSKSSGITLSDVLQAALFFRDKLLEASLDLPETARPRSSDQSKLLKRINALLNTVQLAIVDVYQAEGVSSDHPPSTRAPSKRPTRKPAPTQKMKRRK